MKLWRVRYTWQVREDGIFVTDQKEITVFLKKALKTLAGTEHCTLAMIDFLQIPITQNDKSHGQN